MDYRREYLVRLPLPLAQLYSRAFNDKSPQSRHNNTFYLFEALVKLAAAPAIACYAHELRIGRQPRVPGLDRLLIQLALPSFGQWVGMLRELARHFGSRPEAASHPLGHLWQQLQAKQQNRAALLALYRHIKNGVDGAPAGDQSCSILDVLEALVQYRNGVFGHGGPRFESFYEQEMGPLLFPAANELLEEGVFEFLGPTGSRLVYLTEVRALDEKRIEVGLRELVGLEGERMAPIALARGEGDGLAPNRVAVLWPGRAVPLRFDPLLVYRESETAEEVLFLNRDRNARQVEYLSYTTGKTERDPHTSADLCQLLSLFAGRDVGEHDLQRLSAQSVAETPSAESLLGESSAATVGRVWGDYEILAEIGRGGMGVVYLARQTSLGRLVALKMLPADLAGDAVALARFRREIRHLARCEHPNIVKVLASGTMPDGEPYYTMEYVPGCDLEKVWRELGGGQDSGWSSAKLGQSTWVKAVLSASRKRRDETISRAEGSTAAGKATATTNSLPRPATTVPVISQLPLPPLPELTKDDDDPGGYLHRVCQLVRDAAIALQAVHDQKLVHRDVKPANLMLTSDGSRIVLMDFGLAKGESVALTASRSAGFLGTLRYAAPEQLASAKMEVGPQADVRGLGCVLWELITGRRLFGEYADEAALAAKVLQADVPRLRSVDPGFDRDLEAIVTRATERRVEDRIPSAGQLAQYLQLYLDHKSLPIRPPTGRELLVRWCRQNAFAASLLVAVAILLLVSALGGTTLAVIADRNAREAQEARDHAFENARRAAENAQRADDEKQEAEKERINAERNARRAALEADRRNWLQYGRQIADAEREWAGGNLVQARRHLDLCRWDFRDWEYDFLCAALKQMPTLNGHQNTVRPVAFTPDGQRIVSGSWDQTIRVWDALSGRELLTLRGHAGTVWSLALSRDGRQIVSGSADKTIRTWDALSGRPLLTLKGHTGDVFTVAISPDGKRIASGSADQTIKLWDAASGHELRTFPGRFGTVWSVAFNAAGDQIASGSEDHMIRLWNAATGEEVRTFKGHAGGVGCVAFSPDGKRIASGSMDKTVKLWDLASGHVIRTFQGHTDLVSSLAYSPDGERIASGSTDRTIRVWDVASDQAIRVFTGHTDAVRGVAFSPNGTRIASGSADKTIKLWDLQSRPPIQWFIGHKGGVYSVACSPDGMRLASSGADQTIKVWDASDREIQTLKGHTSVVWSVAFSPGGKQIASGSADRTIKLWDVSSGQLLHTFEGHAGGVSTITFSPDGKTLASGSVDHLIKLWDISSGHEIRTLKSHADLVFCLAFSPDGKQMVSGSEDQTIKIWDMTSTRRPRTLRGHTGSVLSVAFSPDGKTLASGGLDHLIKVWDISSDQQILTAEGHTGGVRTVRFSPDGKRIVSGSEDQTIMIWQASSGQEVLTLRLNTEVRSLALSSDGSRFISGCWNGNICVFDASSSKGVPSVLENAGAVSSVAFSADGKQIVGGSSTGSVKSWDASSGEEFFTLTGHTGSVLSVAVSPDAKRFASGSADKTIRVWRVSSGNQEFELQGHGDAVRTVAFSPDGKWIASGSDDMTIKVWDDASGQETLSLKGHTKGVSSVAFSPDGRRIVSGSDDDTIKLWDAASGQETATIKCSTKGVNNVTFSPDGKRIASASGDKMAKVWDATSGRETLTLKGHTERVNGVVFSPDGKQIASGSGDKTIKVWDATNGREMFTLKGHAEGINSVAFSPDGKRIASGSGDKTIRVWDALPGSDGNRGPVAAQSSGTR